MAFPPFSPKDMFKLRSLRAHSSRPPRRAGGRAGCKVALHLRTTAARPWPRASSCQTELLPTAPAQRTSCGLWGSGQGNGYQRRRSGIILLRNLHRTTLLADRTKLARANPGGRRRPGKTHATTVFLGPRARLGRIISRTGNPRLWTRTSCAAIPAARANSQQQRTPSQLLSCGGAGVDLA